MKCLVAIVALAACAHHSFAAPILRNKLVNRDKAIYVCTNADCTAGELFVVLDSFDDAAIQGLANTLISVPLTSSGAPPISNTGNSNVVTNPGSAGADSSVVAISNPDSTYTSIVNSAQNSGDGKSTAVGEAAADNDKAHSGAGGGVTVDGKSAGGGSGGGSDAFGQGSGGGSGANVVGANGEIISSIVTGAGPDGAFIKGLTDAIADGKFAYSGTGSGVNGDNDYSGSYAGTGGKGSESGAGSGAGPGASGNGIDTGADSGILPADQSNTTPSSSSTGVVAQYGQCGGKEFTGSTVCATGLTCTFKNDWFYQCL